MKYNRFWVKCDWLVTDMSKVYRNLNKKSNKCSKKHWLRTFILIYYRKEHLFERVEKERCAMTKTYRIKSRTRFTCFVTLTIILITILANFALGFSTASSLTVPQYEEIRIQSGDTLWDIAGRYTDNSQDIRSAIHEICQINDISASELYAGMTIKVPVY